MNEVGGYDVEDLTVGMSATFEKTISEADILFFADASGDHNAMHLDDEYAKTTQFRGRIAHGMLTASLISAAIAGHLPGPGSIYLSQNLKFKAPVRPGASVQARVTIKEIFSDKRRAVIETICSVAGTVVIEGDAVVMLTSRVGRTVPTPTVQSSACLSESSSQVVL